MYSIDYSFHLFIGVLGKNYKVNLWVGLIGYLYWDMFIIRVLLVYIMVFEDLLHLECIILILFDGHNARFQISIWFAWSSRFKSSSLCSSLFYA